MGVRGISASTTSNDLANLQVPASIADRACAGIPRFQTAADRPIARYLGVPAVRLDGAAGHGSLTVTDPPGSTVTVRRTTTLLFSASTSSMTWVPAGIF